MAELSNKQRSLPQSVRTIPYLSEFAGHHDLRQVFEDKTPVEDKSSMLGSEPQQREVPLTPTRQQIVDRPLHDSYRHWGINE